MEGMETLDDISNSARKSNDLFDDVWAEIECTYKTQALNTVLQIAERIAEEKFRLGGYLKVVSDNGWFEGYPSFDDYVNCNFGLKKSEARHLMQVYTDLITRQIPWKRVRKLGWPKIETLSPVLTLENLDDWIEKAKGLTLLELQLMLKAKPCHS
jgi:hypothetical protein